MRPANAQPRSATRTTDARSPTSSAHERSNRPTVDAWSDRRLAVARNSGQPADTRDSAWSAHERRNQRTADARNGRRTKDALGPVQSVHEQSSRRAEDARKRERAADVRCLVRVGHGRSGGGQVGGARGAVSVDVGVRRVGFGLAGTAETRQGAA